MEYRRWEVVVEKYRKETVEPAVGRLRNATRRFKGASARPCAAVSILYYSPRRRNVFPTLHQ